MENKFFIPAENEERRFNVNIRHRIFFKMMKKHVWNLSTEKKEQESFAS